MSVYASLRLALAGSLVLAMPIQAATAAVRAQTAVPAGTTDVCTQRDNPDAAGYCARLDEAAAVRGGPVGVREAHGVAGSDQHVFAVGRDRGKDPDGQEAA